MVLFPNCKINLGLRVKEKRTDGYHNLETIFFPLPLRDAAELVRVTSGSGASPRSGPANDTTADDYTETLTEKSFELILSGAPVPGTPGDNLCTRAWKMIKDDFPDIPPLRMYLHKVIPTGGGLGGGSSDGTHTLLLLNTLLDLQLSPSRLQAYAARLGSDCPFFLLNKPCLATGRGELLEALTLDLQNHFFVVIDPQIPVSTAWAFSQITSSSPVTGPTLKEIVNLPVVQWKGLLKNDFELPVFQAHPVLADLKEKLYRAGALYAALTGTGSCIYGIFEKGSGTAFLHQDFQPDSIYVLNLPS